MLQPDLFTTIISAKSPTIPNLALTEVVLNHNAHSCIGAFSASSVSKNDRICIKSFPKLFMNETTHQRSVAHHIKRIPPESGGETEPGMYRAPGKVSVPETIDSFWVLSNWPILPSMFQCHLSVELCVSHIAGITYLFIFVRRAIAGFTVQLIEAVALQWDATLSKRAFCQSFRKYFGACYNLKSLISYRQWWDWISISNITTQYTF